MTGHRHGDPLTTNCVEPPTVLTKQTRRAVDPSCQVVMDAKALYDSLISEQQNQDDERAALEASIVKEDLDALGARARWVPHDRNPMDALTKTDGAHSQPLRQLLRTGVYVLKEETEELVIRKEIKERIGHVPRRHLPADEPSATASSEHSSAYGRRLRRP